MGLSLGLESLGGQSVSGVIPFSGDSLIRMGELNSNLDASISALENYWDAAKNAMTIKKAIKQYGVTASLRSVVGNEGLQIAQGFSMEGFWSTVKETLIKIWEKIKEWWNRFWGMFFSQKKAAKELLSKLKNGNAQLKHDVEFDGPSVEEVLNRGNAVLGDIDKAASFADKNAQGLAKAVDFGDFNARGKNLSNTAANAETSGDRVAAFSEVHIRYRSAGEVHRNLKALIDLSDKLEKQKGKFDKTIDKVIKWLNDTNKTMHNSIDASTGKHVQNPMTRDETATYNDQIKNIKALAAWAKKELMACLNAANGLIARLRAHTAVA